MRKKGSLPTEPPSNPVRFTHVIHQRTRDHLDQLAQHIGTQRNRRVYMKELALHALKHALAQEPTNG